MSEVVDQIRQRAHWDVAVHPKDFDELRVPYEALDDILERAVVSFRGWPVPFIDHREPLLRGDDWIGQDIEARVVPQMEAWRFFTSGQFNHLRVISAEFYESHEFYEPSSSEARPRSCVIEVWEILYYLTEIFELAARLSLTAAGGEEMTINVGLTGLGGRRLVVGDNKRVPFSSSNTTATDRLEQTIVLRRDELIAETRLNAVQMAREFFLRFGWKAGLPQLSEYQQELTRD